MGSINSTMTCCTLCNVKNAKLTRITSIKPNVSTQLCGKCRNGHYTYINIFFKNLSEKFNKPMVTITQDDLNSFTYKFLESKSNCKRRSTMFTDFSQICPMIEEGSRTKQCLVCR